MEPFSRISRQVLVANPWHSYCLDRYVRSDGTEGLYYYVDMPGSVGIVPLFDDGRTVLIRQRRYLLGVDLYEFPIGGMKRGEDPLEVAKRELLEETGLVATRFDSLGSFAPYKGVSTERCHFYLARGLEQRDQQLEPEERITLHRMPLAAARETLFSQELMDGQSLCGWMLLERFLGREKPPA
jgi:8-oxo-dGTP pyrophosphatase MutT (NUDIX family)